MRRMKSLGANMICGVVWTIICTCSIYADEAPQTFKIGEYTYYYSVVEQGVVIENPEVQEWRMSKCESNVPPVAISPRPIGKLAIPETINGHPVVAIGSVAFADCQELTEIVIPKSVDYIGPAAFMSCTNLKIVKMPKKAVAIGAWAFHSCSKLQQIEIPHGVEEIEQATFAGCTALSSVSIPTSVTNIGYYAFAACESLQNVEMPPRLIIIDEGAFAACKSLENVNLPSCLEKIGANAFRLSGLRRLVLPESLQGFNTTSVMGCSNLVSVAINSQVSKLHEFDGCTSLEKITGLRHVKEISEMAFDGTKVVRNVDADATGVKVLENWLVGFEPREEASYEIPDGVNIQDGVFRSLPQKSEIKIGFCPQFDGHDIYWRFDKATDKFPSSSGWFEGCSNLVSIVVGHKFKYVPQCLFKDCTNLKFVCFEYDYLGLSGSVFEGCSSLADFTLPSKPVIAYKWWCMAIPRTLRERLYEKSAHNVQAACAYLCAYGDPEGVPKLDVNKIMDAEQLIEYFICHNPDSTAPGMKESINTILDVASTLEDKKGSCNLRMSESITVDLWDTMAWSIYKKLADTYDDPISCNYMGRHDMRQGSYVSAVGYFKTAARGYARNVIDEERKKKGNSMGSGGLFHTRDSMRDCIEQIRKMGFDSTAELLMTELDAEIRAAVNKHMEEKGICTGTGWAVNSNHVVTCWHVLKDANKIACMKSDGVKIPLKLVACDKANDVAVLKIDGAAVFETFLPLQTRTARLSERVFTIGYPMSSLLGQSQKYTEGTISATSGLGNDGRFYQISTPIQPGNSGGALINGTGEVVGITSAGLNAVLAAKITGAIPQNVNYAIKSRYLSALLDDNEIEYKHALRDSSSKPAEDAVDVVGMATVLVVAE